MVNRKMMGQEVVLKDPLIIFGNDVHRGLSSENKYLDSKYFYDDQGSKLFQQIMDLPEYYLTERELSILRQNKDLISRHINPLNGGFELLELGAGDGLKTQVLIDHFLHNGTPFTYIPIDISVESNERLYRKMKRKFPHLSISPISDDYLQTLHELNQNEHKKVILFLGSNVGNYSLGQALSFYRKVWDNLREGDLILTGFDLIKNPMTILSAYDDPPGITSAFNLNLLGRINRELGGSFDISKFMHYPIYDIKTGAAKSYLVSMEEQDVYIKSLKRSYHFGRWENIFMEISQKYNLAMIERLASDSGFAVIDHFLDDKQYFACSLWEKPSR